MVMVMWITAVLLYHTCYGADSAQMTVINQPNSVIAAASGDNVTLHCFCKEKENTESIIWYKQVAGHEPRVIVTVHKLAQNPVFEDEFKSPRFTVEDFKESCHLGIIDMKPSDEATYYCGLRMIAITFGNGTFLSVRDKPGLSVSVWQRGELDPVPAGASVTLQCSVLSESRAAELQLLWFRAATPQSHPQIIHTRHNSSRQCESVSSTHTCVYNFTKNILSLNDTGTYYCAVTACGRIVFGDGTRVQMERPVDPAVICLAVALGMCVLVIFAQWRNCGQHRVRLKQETVTKKELIQDCDDELNYAALHFNKSRAKRGRGKKQQPQNIIYSDVRCSSVT